MKKEHERKKNEQDKKSHGKEEEKPTDKEIIADLTDSLQHLQAEFENYKKRVDREKEDFMQYANAGLIGKLLPLLDAFELALKSTANTEKFVKGVKMIFTEFHALLEKEGLTPIHAVGKNVDPQRHEVVLTEKSDTEDVILEELQKGYMFHDRVLRSTKVKVGVKKS